MARNSILLILGKPSNSVTTTISDLDLSHLRAFLPSIVPSCNRSQAPGPERTWRVQCSSPCVDGKDFLLALTELHFLPLGSQAVVHSSSLVPAARRPLAGWPALTVPQETQRLFWALLPECTSSRHLPVPHPTIGSILWLLDPDGLQDLPRSLWLLPKRESHKSSAPVDFQI